MQDLQTVVAEFKQRLPAEEEDEFGEYIEPEQNHQSQYYQDFNWDFLVEKKEVLEKAPSPKKEANTVKNPPIQEKKQAPKK